MGKPIPSEGRRAIPICVTKGRDRVIHVYDITRITIFPMDLTTSFACPLASLEVDLSTTPDAKKFCLFYMWGTLTPKLKT
eukprot:1369026-Amorphochlora_amoeboformis.AAC.1